MAITRKAWMLLTFEQRAQLLEIVAAQNWMGRLRIGNFTD